MSKVILALALVTSPAMAGALPASPIATVDQAGGGASGGQAPPAVRAQALANLASYVRYDDYPPSALRAEEQGRVEFRLRIGADGRVTECVVTSSSGSAALDSVTCRIMRSRARFTPARDAQGNAVEDIQDSLLRWSLP